MKIFYVNTQSSDTAAALVQSFINAQPADPEIFSQGNTAEPFQCRLLAPNPDTTTQQTQPFIYVDPTSTTVHISAGLLNQPVFSGTFTISDSVAGQTTNPITYNSSAADVQATFRNQLDANWGVAVVTGNNGGPWTVDRGVAGALANPLTGDASATSPPNSVIEIIHLQAGTSDLHEIYSLQLLQPPAVFATASGSGLPAANVAISQINTGGAGTNAVQTYIWNSDAYGGEVWLTLSLPTGGGIVSASAASPSVITTGAAHNLVIGDSVTISGNSQSALNGTWSVASVASPTTFTTSVNLGSSGTGGLILLTRQIPQVPYNCTAAQLVTALSQHGASAATATSFSVTRAAQGSFSVTFQGLLGGQVIHTASAVWTLQVPLGITGTLNINSAGVASILSGATGDAAIKFQIREIISTVPTTIAWRSDSILRPNLEPTGTIGTTEIPPLMQYMAIPLSNGIDHLVVTFPSTFAVTPSYIAVDVAIGSGGSFIRGEADLTTLTSGQVTLRFNPPTDTSTYVAMLDARV